MQNRGLPVHFPMPSPSVPKPDVYDYARFDQITCAGLQQKYDGSLDN
jgi:hypothetical protein